MHESTVSRVTTGLLIATPRGGMPLKSFFGINIASRGSENDTSAAAVRNMVKRLISQEQLQATFGDEAISKMISDQGIDLARRTVAKYREMLNIPSSSQRRTGTFGKYYAKWRFWRIKRGVVAITPSRIVWVRHLCRYIYRYI